MTRMTRLIHFGSQSFAIEKNTLTHLLVVTEISGFINDLLQMTSIQSIKKSQTATRKKSSVHTGHSFDVKAKVGMCNRIH